MVQSKFKNKLIGKKVLITGVSGYIGSVLLSRLREENIECFGLAGLDANPSLSVNMRIVDLLDYHALHKFLVDIKPNIVCHLASYVNLSRDFEVSHKCIDTNLKGTLNILEAISRLNVERFVFFSSQEVYGVNITPFEEDFILKPPSVYSITKAAGEQLCKVYNNISNLNYTILRLSTVYGPSSSMRGFIPQLIKNALSGANLDLNSGKKKRDYVFIDDVIECVLTSLISSNSECQEFNVGGGVAYTLEELAKLVVYLSHSTSQVKLNVFPDRIGEAEIMFSGIKKAKELLDWEPRISLKEGLTRLVNYCKK